MVFKNKKAYMKTVEVMIAISIVLAVLSFMLSAAYVKQQNHKLAVLDGLKDDNLFRNCAIQKDYNCTNVLINDIIPDYYKFNLSLVKHDEIIDISLPQKDIFVEQYYITGTIEENDPVIVKLYYWKE